MTAFDFRKRSNFYDFLDRSGQIESTFGLVGESMNILIFDKILFLDKEV